MTTFAQRVALAAALTVAIPVAAVAATTAAPVSINYMAIAGIVWFAVDKIIDVLPIKQTTVLQLVRELLNKFLAGKPQG